MKITKELKHATFEWDEETKSFTIYTHNEHGWIEGVGENPNKVTLNKIYAFAFMRFVVRMAQRNWLRGKKRVDNKGHTVVSLDTEELANPHQLVFNIEEE